MNNCDVLKDTKHLYIKKDYDGLFVRLNGPMLGAFFGRLNYGNNADFAKGVEVFYRRIDFGIRNKMSLSYRFSGSIAEPYCSVVFFFACFFFKLDIPKRIQEKWKERDMLRASQGYPPCPNCGMQDFYFGHGHAYEPVIVCNRCDNIVYEADPMPYII